MPTEKSAGAVIFQKEKGNIYYLILQYSPDYWGFPKGRIEKGEELKESARREIEEETGIKDIKFINGFKETIEYFFKRKGKAFFKTAIYFLAETEKREVKLSSEHIDFRWLPQKEALEQLTFKNSKGILEKANEFLKKT